MTKSTFNIFFYP